MADAGWSPALAGTAFSPASKFAVAVQPSLKELTRTFGAALKARRAIGLASRGRRRSGRRTLGHRGRRGCGFR